MTWFKVDDSLAFHAKVVTVGNAPMGLWTRAGAWSAQQLTDGVVPATMVKALGGTRQHALALVAAGLWEDLDNGGYVFHDWDLYQPTSAEVRAERRKRNEVKAKAGRAGGIASGVSRRSTKQADDEADGKQSEAEGQANANENEAPTRPDPLVSQKHSVAALPEGFDAFWLAYPRRVGRGSAIKAWKAATKKVGPDVIASAAAAFGLSVAGTEPKFIPHPSSWLNAERWADERPQLRAVSGGQPAWKMGDWDV